MSAKEKTMKPQEILFEEGDRSTSLYYIKRGVIRIFKRKADGIIEIETLRAGQLIGELSFLDDQPRSASAEALTSAELIEISKSALEEAMSKLPEWFTSLTKTITSRLRAANNKIRLLESVSTEYEVDQRGNRSKEYTYINTSELLRFCTALLAVTSRYGKTSTEEGIQFPFDLLERFANQILQVHSSKVVSITELFKTVGIFKGDLFLSDIKFLDQLISFLNEQNLVAVEKKRTLSEKGFVALTALFQSRASGQMIDDKKMKLNIAPALKTANQDLTALQELLDQQFVSDIKIVNADEVNVEFNAAKNLFDYRAFSLISELGKMNEGKRKH